MQEITLVTGGSGFIGSHLVERLVKEGRNVRCLARNFSDVSHLKSLGVDIYYGDLRDKKSLIGAVRGVKIIYHLAAQVRPVKVLQRRSKFNASFREINTQGTINLAESAIGLGIAKFIFFSSIAAAGIGENLDESADCRPVTEYGRTKLAAERYLSMMAGKRNLHLVIVRPGQIYGPRGYGMLSFLRLIKHRVFPIIEGGANFIPVCYIDDLIEGALLAERRAAPGSIYFMFEGKYTFIEYAKTIAGILNVNESRIAIPRGIALTAAALKESAEKICGLKLCPFCMDISRGGILSVSMSISCSLDKARTELGYNPRIKLPEGMSRTVSWFKANGLL